MLKNFTVIEVISSKTKSVLTFYPDKMKFNFPTAEDLKFPKHVQLLIDPKGRNFAIRACKEDEPNAVVFFNRGDGTKPYPITLRYQAANALIAQTMGWNDPSKYYLINGQLFPEECAIAFNLNDAEEQTIKAGSKKSQDDDEAEDDI